MSQLPVVVFFLYPAWHTFAADDDEQLAAPSEHCLDEHVPVAWTKYLEGAQDTLLKCDSATPEM
jgi:hypothetical protein